MEKTALPLLTAALLCGVRIASAQGQSAQNPSVQELTSAEVFKDADGGTLNVRLYLPPAPPAGKKLPLVLFLHGAGERGADNASQLKHGIESLIRYGREANDPAILLVPQCPAGEKWVEVPWSAPAHTMQAQPAAPLRLALALLREKMAALPVDPARVYITGISMGGYGTWDAIQREPRLFAAALPICGGADTAQAPAIKHLPIWTFHGEKDTAVPVARSRDIVKALEACGSNIQYREYPGAGHDVWTRTYADAGVLKWFFSQKQKTQ
jgi:predicted peptidase